MIYANHLSIASYVSTSRIIFFFFIIIFNVSLSAFVIVLIVHNKQFFAIRIKNINLRDFGFVGVEPIKILVLF